MIHSNGTAPAGGISLPGDQGRGAISKKAVPQSPASRPDDLGVTPWYFDDYSMDVPPGPGDQSSYPSHYNNGRENIRPELASTRNSSMENDQSRPSSTLPRKACMDIRDAIALLDETCPNPEASPSLTPRTPRTPLTPYPRNKRARSKSSDNSSNYSNERLSERSVDNPKSHEKEKKRPFLRKIGISKTEDRPFLYKFAPKIIGKPYLEKIGPSRAVEKPFLDQIGSSKTLDKFVFDTPKIERKKEQVVPIFSTCLEKQKELAMSRGGTKSFPERRRSGKAYLSKMYSFETEDLDESTPLKNHRDPVRVASLNDVLDAGPSSMPHIEIPCSQSNSKLKPISTSAVELVKCRVTTSEEIVSSTTCLSSPAEATGWEYSPRRKHWAKMISSTPKMLVRRRPDGPDSKDGIRSDDSTPNSPTKRTISSVSPEFRVYKQAEVAFIKNLEFSPSKTRRQGSEDILDKKNNTHAQIERWGISSDELYISRETVASYEPSSSSLGPQSESNSLESSKLVESLGKETFKQLQEKFKMQGVPDETYAAFKQRTKGQFPKAVGLRRVIAREKMISPTYDISNSLKSEKKRSESPKRTLVSERCKLSEASGASEEEAEPPPEDNLRLRVRRGTVRSVLRKQDGVDHLSDQESDTNASLKRTKGKILHEASQETMDLLTELRKVKSLLKTPSMEKDFDLEKLKDVTKLPKKVLLTDKEFCLSFERENSIRRPSKVKTVAVPADQLEPKTDNEDIKEKKQKPVAALFEKRCMSLDFVDDERVQKPELRTISLASGRVLLSETEEVLDSSELALNGDSKSIYSDVFNTPDELEEKVNNISVLEPDSNPKPNNCLEVDTGNTLDQKGSPKKKLQPQGRTSDAYEIISPRTTPFRMKKRLGRISVEDTMKQESFTLNKTDCKSVIVQKKTKCFPL